MLRRRPSLTAALAALLLFAALCGLAAAVPPDGDNEKRLDATIAYLEQAQNLDGGFGFSTKKPASDPGVSAWVAYALAAAGTNPQDQAKVGGVDVYSYLTKHTAELSATTDWERVLLVAVASGTPPRDFGGTDPVARILERQLPDGSFPHQAGWTSGGVNDTAFAVLALARVPDPAAQAAIPKAVDWLIDAQNDDGSWGWNTTGDRSVDMTGAVIQALNAGERPGTDAEREGFASMRRLQNDDGGFPQYVPGDESNVASTAWAVQAMWSAGIDPRTWDPAGRDALDYMGDRQQPDGSIQYQASLSSNDLWMTAQVAPAFAGHPHPIPPPPRKVEPEQTPTPAASATPTGTPAATEGQSGRAAAPDRGAISGGGGEGAPLFSRPQPQSRGRTAGGARQIDPKRARKPQARRPRSPTAAPAAGATPVPITVQPPAAATATATPRPSSTPTPTPSAPGGEGQGLAGDTGDGSGSGGTGSLPYVTGTLVSSGVSQDAAAAPGLRGAGAGGSNDDAALVIAIALALAVLIGWGLEIRPAVRT